jgi:endonuclease YncB( thermonuclease family)
MGLRQKFALILLCCLTPVVSFGQAIEGARVRAMDGDSFEILVNGVKQGEVRLQHIDAPELAQPYGPEAKAALASLIETQAIRIVPYGIDQFGRKLAEVWVGDELINAALVRSGSAWAFRPSARNADYQALQQGAKQAGLGLWGEANAMPPWDYRDAQRGISTPRFTGNRLPSVTRRTYTAPPVSRFTGRCQGKRYCRQMGSCAEAQFYYRQCGVASLDGDRDGRACEDLCRFERQ